MKNIALIALYAVKKDILDETAIQLKSTADVECDNTHALSSWLTPSHASMFTGKIPHQHGSHSLSPTGELQRIWSWFREIIRKRTFTDEFMRRARPTAVAKSRGLEEGVQSDAALVRAHVHTSDVVGHPFTDHEQQVRQMYHLTEDQIQGIRLQMGPNDELMILSDCSAELTWLRHESGGGHSMRTYSRTTLDTRLESVFGVRGWVENHAPDPECGVQEEDTSFPEEQLHNLGYIE